ncbi:methionyl-tRNA formyltransferase [Pseudozobellia sp. WGM2]|uniref:methionyl-tRNA formyltransferase n=1 Tax=Pseudozobellia sp. WGM2 TaxID=2787625 RepID=UPI001AE00453|nr:methionyl-tRNA formyltransferase [Pseudozobellia sp. WGM2]
MKDLRIVFMGTPEFATTILKRLVEENYTIAGVITAPDRPAGRGRKLQESDVKKYASEQGLRVLQPTNLKSEEFLVELKSLEANLQIVVAFRMLPKVVWAMPDYGTFNLHASLLPDYRGAAPINWAIINGETETGVTTFFIDEKIDTGEIILQERTTIDPEDNAGALHDKLMHLGAALVVKTVKQIAFGDIKTQKQVTSEPVKEAFKIHKDTCKIDWNQSLEAIHNHIRGLSPYPAAWSNFINGENEMSLKIYKSTIEKDDHNFEIGHVLHTKKEIKVAVKNGFIKLLELQLPGKKKMKTQDVLNGLEIENFARML